MPAPTDDPNRLRTLAAWYRDFAERAHAPWVWERRLQTAADLEHEAALIEIARQKLPVSPDT